jgi:hypothetical protein
VIFRRCRRVGLQRPGRQCERLCSDSSAQQYIHNWGNVGLARNYYYRIGVRLDDGQTYFVNIALR